MAESPRFAPSGSQIPLTHGSHHAVVVEVGGAVRSYRLGDWEVLDGYGAEDMCSAARGQTLVPWPNRLRDGRYTFGGAEHQLPLSEPERHNAIHGLARWASWHPTDASTNWVRMELLLHPQPGYPHSLALANEYRLDHDGLTVTTTARNVGTDPCPYGAGAHPYISVGTPTIDDAVLTAPGARWLPTDDQAIPTGRASVKGTPYDFRGGRFIADTALDTAFADLARDGDGWATVALEEPDGRRRVEIGLGPGYRYYMLFTGDSLPDERRRRRSLGVEPMTCPPNALATGEDVAVLAPNETLATQWRVTPHVQR